MIYCILNKKLFNHIPRKPIISETWYVSQRIFTQKFHKQLSSTHNHQINSIFILHQLLIPIPTTKIATFTKKWNLTHLVWVRIFEPLISKSKLLSILFEKLLRNPILVLSPLATLCFEEIHGHYFTHNLRNMVLIVRNQIVGNSFNELTVELTTQLDIFPLKELDLSDDIEELVHLWNGEVRVRISLRQF
jgi:hypothetical protein